MRLGVPFLIALFAASTVSAGAQSGPPPHATRKTVRPGAVHVAGGQVYQARKKFVLDVIRSAVSLPQADPQDRLRVLVSAARLARSVSPSLARALAEEGAGIETQLVAGGTKPSASMLATGLVNCRAAVNFVESLSAESVAFAADSLAHVAGACGKQTLPVVERKLDDALRNATVPPGAMLAAMQASGLGSVWSQRHFEALFSSLPDPQRATGDAPLYAAIYDEVAPAVGPDAAKAAGLKFLEWLGKMDTSPERIQAVTLATERMKKVLGEKDYEEALRSSVMATQAAHLAGQPFEIAPPEEEASVSVLQAMANKEDQSDALQGLAPAQRARQAAAYGFSAGKSGDHNGADRYFDIAFSAASDAWQQRFPGKDAVAIIDEISSAAAHVDPVTALGRAQSLQDPSAEAISMLAVAQVVLTRQEDIKPPGSAATAAPR